MIGGAAKGGAGSARGAAATRGHERAIGARGTLRSMGRGAVIGGAQAWLAKLTGATLTGTRQWRYTWEEVRAGAAANTWAAPTGGRTHTTHGHAYNRMEAGGTSSGVQPTGIDAGNLTGTYDVVPVGPGAIVEMMGPFGAAVSPWCSFALANAVDGACEEEA